MTWATSTWPSGFTAILDSWLRPGRGIPRLARPDIPHKKEVLTEGQGRCWKKWLTTSVGLLSSVCSAIPGSAKIISLQSQPGSLRKAFPEGHFHISFTRAGTTAQWENILTVGKGPCFQPWPWKQPQTQSTKPKPYWILRSILYV